MSEIDLELQEAKRIYFEAAGGQPSNLGERPATWYWRRAAKFLELRLVGNRAACAALVTAEARAFVTRDDVPLREDEAELVEVFAGVAADAIRAGDRRASGPPLLVEGLSRNREQLRRGRALPVLVNQGDENYANLRALFDDTFVFLEERRLACPCGREIPPECATVAHRKNLDLVCTSCNRRLRVWTAIACGRDRKGRTMTKLVGVDEVGRV